MSGKKNKVLFFIFITMVFLFSGITAIAQEKIYGDVNFLIGTANGRQWLGIECADLSKYQVFQIRPFSPWLGTPGPQRLLQEELRDYEIPCDCGEKILVKERGLDEIKKEPRDGYPYTLYFSNEVIGCTLRYPNGNEVRIPIPQIKVGWAVEKRTKLATAWGKIKYGK